MTSTADAVHRLLAAASAEGEWLGEFIRKIGRQHSDDAVLQALSAQLELGPTEIRRWQLEQLGHLQLDWQRRAFGANQK